MENFRKSSESAWKSSENRRILYNKKKITWSLGDTNFSSRVEKYFSTLEDKFSFSRVLGTVVDCVNVNPSARALKPWLVRCAGRVRTNKSRHCP